MEQDTLKGMNELRILRYLVRKFTEENHKMPKYIITHPHTWGKVKKQMSDADRTDVFDHIVIHRSTDVRRGKFILL